MFAKLKYGTILFAVTCFLLSSCSNDSNKVEQDNLDLQDFELNLSIDDSENGLLNLGAKKKDIAASCETQEKKCRTRKCIEDELEGILGDGERDVDINYRRNTFSATIEWAYQDC